MTRTSATGSQRRTADGAVPGFAIGAVGGAFLIAFGRDPAFLFLVMGAVGAASACFAVAARVYLASALATAAGTGAGFLLLLCASGARVVRTSDLAWLGAMLAMLEVPTLVGFVLIALPGRVVRGAGDRRPSRSRPGATLPPARHASAGPRVHLPQVAEPRAAPLVPQIRVPVPHEGRHPRRSPGSGHRT